MNEITLYTVQDMSTMANAIAKSGLFGMKNQEQAMALMLVAQAEGMHPATITQDYDIIQGKACRKTHSVMARFQQMGGTVEWHQLDETVADATFTHKAGGKVRIKWTLEQAKRASLTGKDNWKNYPRAMLRARCLAEGIRTVYPAAIGGMMVAEEAQDSPQQEPRDMGTVERIESEPKPTPPYPPEVLAANLPKWKEYMASGKLTADQAIARILSTHTLTDAQKEAIRDLEAEAKDIPIAGSGDPWVADMEAAEVDQ